MMLETFLVPSRLEKKADFSKASHETEKHARRFRRDRVCARTRTSICGPLTTLAGE